MLAHLLPWNIIGVMLQGCRNNAPRIYLRKHIGNSVDPAGCAGGKDNLSGLRTQERCAGFSGVFICSRAVLADRMDSPVYISTPSFQFPDCVQNLPWHLCGCRIVEIYKWFSADLMLQSRKVLANFVYIKAHG